jgi:hypothetical protein
MYKGKSLPYQISQLLKKMPRCKYFESRKRVGFMKPLTMQPPEPEGYLINIDKYAASNLSHLPKVDVADHMPLVRFPEDSSVGKIQLYVKPEKLSSNVVTDILDKSTQSASGKLSPILEEHQLVHPKPVHSAFVTFLDPEILDPDI